MNNLQGNKSDVWNVKKQKTPNQNSKKEKVSKYNEDSAGRFWDNLKHTNIHMMGMLEGQKRDQEIENLFEKQ